MDPQYTGDDIVHLSEVEMIQQRPEMFFADLSDPTDLLKEALCIGLDNLLTRNATALTIRLHADGGATVSDDGLGLCQETRNCGRTLTELIFTELGSCSHHKNDSASSAFCQAGIVCSNALSYWMTVDNRREGVHWQTRFVDGVATGRAKDVGQTTESGLQIHFLPNPVFFQSSVFSETKLIEWFQQLDLSLSEESTVTLRPVSDEIVQLHPLPK